MVQAVLASLNLGQDVNIRMQEEVQDVTLAAVMPYTDLGDFNWSNSGSEYVTPLTHPQSFWDCLLDGPNVSKPLHVHALIDNGLSPVLIDSALVDKLGLRWWRLPQKLCLSLAVGNSGVGLCEEWVKLHPSTLQGHWSSKTLCAVITSNPSD